KAFYDSEIHQNIPAEAAEITDSEWQEFIENQGKRAYINGQIIDITNKVFDTNAGTWRDKTQAEILAEKKQKLLAKLTVETKNYIEQFYPRIKQQSDISDKENGESYLALQGIDVLALRKDLANETINNYPDFQTALNNILTKYQSTNQLVNYWLEQGLKIAFRNYFVFLVKQEYYSLKQQIENATDITQFPDIVFNTPFPEALK
ncbi:hypothetical protein, partial [Persephonella sp.]